MTVKTFEIYKCEKRKPTDTSDSALRNVIVFSYAKTLFSLCHVAIHVR
jgi:hypothetical protein